MILFGGVETRTGFVCKIPVPVYDRFGKLSFEVSKQIAQGLALLRCSRVRWSAACGNTADIAYTNAAGVVPRAMRTDLGDRSSLLHRSIQQHKEMIADVAEVALQVPAAHIIYIKVLACFRSGAMHDYLIYLPHYLICLSGLWTCSYNLCQGLHRRK